MYKFSFNDKNIGDAETYSQHQKIRAIFSTSKKILFRIDDLSEITVYADELPVVDIKCKSSVLPSINVEAILNFRIRMNVEKRTFIKNGKGKRVAIQDTAEIVHWLNRTTARNGFSINNLHIFSKPYSVHANKKGRLLTFNVVDFEGTLKVLDADLFKKALEEGIGSGKGMGLGLLELLLNV